MSTKPQATNGLGESVEAAGTEPPAGRGEGARDYAPEGVDEALSFHPRGLAAIIQSTSCAAKSLEAINLEVLGYTRQSVEDGMAAGRALLGVRSVQDVVEIQTRYSREAFERFVACATTVNELAVSAIKEALTPFGERAAGRAGRMR